MLIIALSAALASAQPAAAAQAAAPASGQTSGAPAPAKTAAATVTDPSKQIICRVWTPTGTRLGGVHACKTRAEWDQLGFDTGKTITQVQMQAYDGAPGH